MNLITEVANLIKQGGRPMESPVVRTRGRMISKERKAELRRKGRLILTEAAEYLEMAPKTLYNKKSAQKKDPKVSAPLGRRGRNGWEFDVPDLDAWERQIRPEVR